MTTCSVEGCDKAKFCRGWCMMHYGRWQRHHDLDAARKTRTLDERLIAGTLVTDVCHWWILNPSQPYGKIRIGGKQFQVHRVVYERAFGPIPEGYEIDHVCRHPRCVRLDHLEAVTGAENLRRQGAVVTHCAQGHPFDEVNTYVRPNGRGCKDCRRRQNREAMRRRRAKEAV
jgi:HNH endonuclease